MKILADENIEKPIIDYLRSRRYDIYWIAEKRSSIGDNKVLSIANKEKRILITNDKDFGELIFLQRKLSTGIVLLRFKSEDALNKVKVLRKVFPLYARKLKGHFTVISERRIRFRYLPK